MAVCRVFAGSRAHHQKPVTSLRPSAAATLPLPQGEGEDEAGQTRVPGVADWPLTQALSQRETGDCPPNWPGGRERIPRRAVRDLGLGSKPGAATASGLDPPEGTLASESRRAEGRSDAEELTVRQMISIPEA